MYIKQWFVLFAVIWGIVYLIAKDKF